MKRPPTSSDSLEENEAYQYAALRNILYRKGKAIEILVNYEPGMHSDLAQAINPDRIDSVYLCGNLWGI